MFISSSRQSSLEETITKTIKLFFFLETVKLFFFFFLTFKEDPGRTVVKNLPANTGDTRDWGSIPRSGRSRGVENSNPLHSITALFVIPILAWEIS